MPFLHPAIAWAALALISIPIIIHLLNRQRQRKLDWAAMEFLLKALKKTRRRVRIEQLILLLMRVAIMALIAFFLARPLLQDREFGWLAEGLKSEDKVFVLDDSLSMSRRESGSTSFGKAAEALTAEIDNLARNRSRDRLTIVLPSRPDVPLIRGGFVDQERAAQLEASLDGLEPASTRLSLARTLDKLAEFGTSADSAQRPRSISILTDLRAADWTDGSGGPSEDLARALGRLVESEENPARIIIYDVGSTDHSNVAVVDASVDGSATVGIPTRVVVKIENLGTSAVRDLQVQLEYGPVSGLEDGAGSDGDTASGELGAATQRKTLTALAPPIREIAGGEVATSTISCTFRKPGAYWSRVVLTGSTDPLPGDNQLAFVVDVVESTPVLIVSGEPSSEAWDDETHYLALALDPGDDASSGVEPVVVVEDSLPSGSLDAYGAIFLANVYSLPEEFRRRLGRWVRAGGALCIFLGDQVDPAVWSRDFGTALGPADDEHPARDLLPAKIGEVFTSQTEGIGLAPAYEHAFFEFLRDGGEPYVDDVRFQSAYQLEPFATTMTLASFSRELESPAWVERQVDAGRVLLFASTVDQEWNNWARNVTYLMVLQKLVETVAIGRSRGAEYVAGQPIEIPVDIASEENVARLRAPDWPKTPESSLRATPRRTRSPEPGDGETKVESRSTADEFRFLIDEKRTRQAGHVFLATSARGAAEPVWRALAIRSAREESDLRRLAETDLARLYPEIDLRVVRDADRFSEAGRGSFEISDLLLGLLIVFLLVEGVLACWFAHHRRNTPAPAPRGPTP